MRINFNGLKRELLIAERKLLNLEKNSPPVRLKGKEKKDYLSKLEEGFSLSASMYKRGILESKIEGLKSLQKYEDCKKYGHVEGFILQVAGDYGTACRCKRCGENYIRPLTSDELDHWNRFMQTSLIA